MLVKVLAFFANIAYVSELLYFPHGRLIQVKYQI